MIVSAWSGHMDFINEKYISTIGGKLENVHKSASSQFLIEESQWFNINYEQASVALRDVFKNYQKYLKLSRKQRKYSKDNFSFENMIDKLDNLLSDSILNEKPMSVGLKLPKLKKSNNNDIPKLNLPKLKKVGEDKTPKLKLPKLKKV